MPAPLGPILAGAAKIVGKKVASKAAAKKAIANKVAVKTAKKIEKAKKTAEKKDAAASARGLKAANKPTNKTGTKADRKLRSDIQGNSNLIKNADPARPNRTRGGSLYAQKTYGGLGLGKKNLTPKQAERQASLSKELNPIRKKAAKAIKKKDK